MRHSLGLSDCSNEAASPTVASLIAELDRPYAACTEAAADGHHGRISANAPPVEPQVVKNALLGWTSLASVGAPPFLSLAALPPPEGARLAVPY